jgi:hypothetical protein
LEFGQLLIQLQGVQDGREGFVELDNVNAILSVDSFHLTFADSGANNSY